MLTVYVNVCNSIETASFAVVLQTAIYNCCIGTNSDNVHITIFLHHIHTMWFDREL